MGERGFALSRRSWSPPGAVILSWLLAMTQSAAAASLEGDPTQSSSAAEHPSPEPSEPRLTYSAPPECGSTEDLERAIEDLAHTTLEKSTEEYRVRAQVTSNDADDERPLFSVRVEIASRSGLSDRTFEAESCPVARDAIVVMIALLLNPDAAMQDEEQPEPTAAASPDETSHPPAQARARVSDSPAPTTPRPWLTLVGLSLVGALGIMPKPSGGLEGRLGLSRGAWGVELRPSALLPQRGAIDAVAGAETRFAGLGLALVGCVATPAERIAGRVCAGPAVLGLRGQSFGISDPGASTAFWGTLRGEVGASMRLYAHLHLDAGLGLEFAPSPPIFAASGLGVLHEVKSLAPLGWIGLSWRF